MPCYVEPPTHTQEEWLAYLLCQACRFLTKEQIQSIGPLDIYQDLMQWYEETGCFSAKRAGRYKTVI